MLVPIRLAIEMRSKVNYSGKTFTILARNASRSNRYIQSAKLNGKQLDTWWIPQSEVVRGGTLELELGPQPNEAWRPRPHRRKQSRPGKAGKPWRVSRAGPKARIKSPNLCKDHSLSRGSNLVPNALRLARSGGDGSGSAVRGPACCLEGCVGFSEVRTRPARCPLAMATSA